MSQVSGLQKAEFIIILRRLKPCENVLTPIYKGRISDSSPNDYPPIMVPVGFRTASWPAPENKKVLLKKY